MVTISCPFLLNASQSHGQSQSGVLCVGSLHKARRLTPENETDYSPALSSDEKWLAVASGSGKTGESDVVVMKAKTGSHRRTVAKNGGWPTFAADGKSLFFHRQSEDGW